MVKGIFLLKIDTKTSILILLDNNFLKQKNQIIDSFFIIDVYLTVFYFSVDIKASLLSYFHLF